MMKSFQTKAAPSTGETIALALKRAAELGSSVVLATSSGRTAELARNQADAVGFRGDIVAVTLAYGYASPGRNEVDPERYAALEARGVVMVTAAHALSGAERGLSRRYHTILPVEVIAATLKMFSSGVKVCVEVGTMALDAGKIPYRRPVVCVGGSGSGADTACVITPSYSAEILGTRVHEILCKPY